jgi:hypothetical protein
METFDSTKKSLPKILEDITEGNIQLPDFQRGWVWNDDHVRDLLVSIARSFPVGAVMMMETGGDVKFQVRPIEGVNLDPMKEPRQLILDGQQRLTTLTQALALKSAVDTFTSKGKKIKRHYYFNILKALEGEEYLGDAIVGVDENRQIKSNFGRDVDLDLSTSQLECEQLYFPCDQVINSDSWERDLLKYAQDSFPTYMDFREKIVKAFRSYMLPVIELKKETSKEAVCLVFEKVNTGGVALSVFELVTASYAADGYNLRDDWYGSEIRQIEPRGKQLAHDALLDKVENTDFLQAITLLYTHERKLKDIAAGREHKQIRPVSAKRVSVLDLPLEHYKKWADDVQTGFGQAAHFLRKECFFSTKDLPYRTQVVPLAAVLSAIGSRWREPRIHQKLAQWYWCGVLGELYGGAVETRMANDFEELLAWFEDDAAIPRTVKDASFQPDRLDSLKTRLSAAYKGINVLILREGARDFFWNDTVQALDHQDISLDIHHIFPQDWCAKQGIPASIYDSIINKTPISYKANRKIGGAAPSLYLSKIQNDEQVKSSNEEMDEVLMSHHIDPVTLRNDDFETFMTTRKNSLIVLIEASLGKKVIASNET